MYKIGELAARSGVPVKTIRFYSDSGLLPPSQIEPSGYRLYSDADQARLRLIRTLRESGVALPAIRRLLEHTTTTAAVLQLQLDTIDMELRTLQRQRTLLQRALAAAPDAALELLSHDQALARLDALEREALLDRFLQGAFADVPAHPEWKAQFWRMATQDLPAELDDAQFAAWLELAELVTDADFIQRLQEIGKSAWSAMDAGSRGMEWSQRLHELYAAAFRLHQAGKPPDSAPGQALVERYLEQATPQLPASARTPAAVLAHLERNSDPRASRYWELIAILRGWQTPTPTSVGHAFLVAGLRVRVAASPD